MIVRNNTLFKARTSTIVLFPSLQVQKTTGIYYLLIQNVDAVPVALRQKTILIFWASLRNIGGLSFKSHRPHLRTAGDSLTWLLEYSSSSYHLPRLVRINWVQHPARSHDQATEVGSEYINMHNSSRRQQRFANSIWELLDRRHNRVRYFAKDWLTLIERTFAIW